MSKFGRIKGVGKTAGFLAVVTIFAMAACAATANDAAKSFSTSDDGTRPVVNAHSLDTFPVECESVAAVDGREASLLPTRLKFKLVWNDEFDGDRLDETKWSWRTNFWGRAAHWFATPEDGALEVKDGLLRMKLVKRPDGQFVSPQLQTGEVVWDNPAANNPKNYWPLSKRKRPKFMHRYGYYECRCRLQQKAGWWSAFWMQSPMQGCSLDPRRAGIEHDIMESFDPGRVIQHCFHMNGSDMLIANPKCLFADATSGLNFFHNGLDCDHGVQGGGAFVFYIGTTYNKGIASGQQVGNRQTCIVKPLTAGTFGIN